MRARYYQPSTGRFLSQDPVWSTNLFVYADNNPITNIDPEGELLETAFDAASLAESSISFAADPSLVNGAFLAWDIAATFVPGLPGSYSAKAFNYGRKVLNSSKVVRRTKEFVSTLAKVVPSGAAKTSTKLLNQFNSAESLIQGAGNLTKVKAGMQGFVKGNGPSIFKAITNGGTLSPKGYYTMPDGTVISKYFSSTSGDFTIFINQGSNAFKIRITP
jgi:uncharacterized protein RhaS with RHS repeats